MLQMLEGGVACEDGSMRLVEESTNAQNEDAALSTKNAGCRVHVDHTIGVEGQVQHTHPSQRLQELRCTMYQRQRSGGHQHPCNQACSRHTRAAHATMTAVVSSVLAIRPSY